jgi:hypothetical protein
MNIKNLSMKDTIQLKKDKHTLYREFLKNNLTLEINVFFLRGIIHEYLITIVK